MKTNQLFQKPENHSHVIHDSKPPPTLPLQKMPQAASLHINYFWKEFEN
jgi:hypothetical protein